VAGAIDAVEAAIACGMFYGRFYAIRISVLTEWREANGVRRRGAASRAPPRRARGSPVADTGDRGHLLNHPRSAVWSSRRSLVSDSLDRAPGLAATNRNVSMWQSRSRDERLLGSTGTRVRPRPVRPTATMTPTTAPPFERPQMLPRVSVAAKSGGQPSSPFDDGSRCTT